MHVDIVLVSCNENPTYYLFFPYIKPIWEKFLNAKCVLIYVGDVLPDILEEFKDDIIIFKPIENIHTAFIAQNVRLLYPALFTDKNVLIADIDCIPLNSHYYLDKIRDFDNSKFINYSFDPEVFVKKEHNIPYSLANSMIWNSIFNINNVEDIIERLKEWYKMCGRYEFNNKFRSKCVGFHFDQQIFYKYLEEWNSKSGDLVLYNLSVRNRFNPSKNFNQNVELEKIKRGLYDDYFFLRPFKEFYDFKINLKNFILNKI